MSLKTLTEWMTLLCGAEGRFEDGALSVHVYGVGDAAYLVLEREISPPPHRPHISDQYVLHPLPGANPLHQQLQFIAESEFDLNSVMSRLDEAEYKNIEAGDINEIAQFATVKVARYRIRENL